MLVKTKDNSPNIFSDMDESTVRLLHTRLKGSLRVWEAPPQKGWGPRSPRQKQPVPLESQTTRPGTTSWRLVGVMRAPLTISWPVRGFQSVLFCIDQSEALMDHTPNENSSTGFVLLRCLMLRGTGLIRCTCSVPHVIGKNVIGT